MTPRRPSPSRASAALALATSLALAGGACVGLPWGAGGAEPSRETARAFVRTIDAAMLSRASERLAERLTEPWYAGAALTVGEDAPDIDWKGLVLVPGRPRIELAPLGPVALTTVNMPASELVVHVPLRAVDHTITLASPDGAVCSVAVSVAEGELDVPLGFSADKLGRLQSVVQAGAAYRASSDITPNAILKADLSLCLGMVDPGARLAALGSAFVAASARAVGTALQAELPAALGLDVAFGWSAAVNADPSGAGFLRASLRMVASDGVRRSAEAMQVAYAVSIEADPHPCMGNLALSLPRPEHPVNEQPPGASLHVTALARAIEGAWLAGAVCAERLGRVPVQAEELSPLWPALIALGPEAELSLQLWPATLPRVAADPSLEDGLSIEVERLQVDIIVTYEGARWRAATIEVDVDVSGRLWVDEQGVVELDPAAVEMVVLSKTAGFAGEPADEAVALIVAPLVEALVLDRPLAQVPPALAPEVGQTITVGGDYLSWPTR